MSSVSAEAVLDATGASYLVSVPTSEHIANLLLASRSATLAVVNSATFGINGGTVSAGRLDVDQGTLFLDGVGRLTFTGGSLTFNAGVISMQNSGSIVIGAAAVMNLGSASLVKTLLVPVTNAGLLDFTVGTLDLSTAGSITSSGVVRFNSPATFTGSDTTARVVNNGTFDINPTHTGSVALGAFTNAGTIAIGNGTLNTGGTVVFNAGSRVTGNGAFVVGAKTITLNADTTFDNARLTLSGGTFTGAGKLVVNKAFTFESGQINSGTFVIGPAATFDTGSAVTTKTISRPTINNGTINLTAGTLNLTSNGTLTNNGTIIFDNPATRHTSSSIWPAILTNNGTLLVNPTHTGSVAISRYHNNGTLVIGGGTLTNNGSIEFGNGARVVGPGTFRLSGDIYVTGTTTFDNDLVTIDDYGPNGSGPIVFNKTFLFNAGTLIVGKTIIGPAASMNFGTLAAVHYLPNALENNGTVDFTAGTVSLNYFSNTGTFTNNGTFIFNNPKFVFSSTTNVVPLINNATLSVNRTNTGSLTLPSLINNATLAIGGGSLSPSTSNFGSFTFNGGSRVTGPGQLWLSQSTAFAIAGDTTFDNARVYLAGGTLSGAGTATFTRSVTFAGGYLSGTGKTILTSTATMAAGYGTLARSLENNGTINASNGFSVYSPGLLNNLGTVAFNTPGGQIFVSASNAALVVNAGTFAYGTGAYSAAAFTNNGTVTVASVGTLTLSATVAGAGTIDASGDLTVNVSLPGQTLVGSGTAAVTGSRVVRAIRTATLAVPTNAKSTLVANGTPSGTSRISTLNLASTGAVDLNDNALIVDADDEQAASIKYDALRDFILTGRAGGTWTGKGITSGAAVASVGGSSVGAIGIAQASELFDTFPATFSGQAVDSTTVLTRYAYLGDANLDQSVDTLDFARLAANFGTGVRWAAGDFDYDGTVSSIDFAAFVANFGKTVPVSLPAPLPATLVPEATGVAAIVGGIGAIGRRRPRRCLADQRP